MKNLNDIRFSMKMELQATIQRRYMCDMDYYVFYQETTPEHDGHFSICSEPPANPNCQNVAMRIRRDQTEEQILSAFMNVVGPLLILEKA